MEIIENKFHMQMNWKSENIFLSLKVWVCALMQITELSKCTEEVNYRILNIISISSKSLKNVSLQTNIS